MLLTCDIGNTNTKCGVFSEGTLNKYFIFPSVNEVKNILVDDNIEDIVISSVVPDKLKELKSFLPDKIRITEINSDSSFNLTVNYKTPKTLGIDRLCACEGAFYLLKQSQHYKYYNEKTFLITVSLGTATTIDFISFPGIFEGGMIAPGPDLMGKSLQSGTAQLPLTGVHQYASFAGKSTTESIASGIINSTVGLIERALWICKSEMKAKDIFVFITGGNASVITQYLDISFVYEKALVLYGINALAGNNIK